MSKNQRPYQLKPGFSLQAAQNIDTQAIFPAIGTLMSALSQYQTEDETAGFHAEDHIRESFEAFLTECDFQMAKKDFAHLLDETSGEPRGDGTITYYHQLSAILMFLSAVQDGTISLKSLEAEGGLETFVRTHLRHDSVEDTKSTLNKFGKQLTKNTHVYDGTSRKELEMGRNVFVYRGVELLTKKVPLTDPYTKEVIRDPVTDKIIKKDLFPDNRAYMNNLLVSDFAHGAVWILKQLDVIHNQGTIESPKFPTEKRLVKCNEIEDMFGPRLGMAHAAKEKWPEFASAIDRFDSMMGAIVYLNFGALEFVDLAYPDDPNKFKEGGALYPLWGVEQFMAKALEVDVPRAFNPLHIWLDRMHLKRDKHPDPDVRQRADNFLKHCVYPVLKKHKKHFPRIFPANDSGDPNTGFDRAFE